MRAALGGDHAPLLRLGRWAERGSQRVPARVYSDAMQTANECQEGPFPWDPAAPAADRLRQARARAAAIPSSALFPFDADTLLNDSEVAQLCSKWPLPQDSPLPSGPLPDVPTLLLSGEDDLRTPVEAAERVAGSIRGARLLTVPGVGHGVLDGASVCPRRAVDDFFAGRPPRPCTPGSAPAFADPVPPRSLRRMPTAPGHHGRAGRTLAAVYATVNDVDEAFGAATYSSRDLARVGGLRGGWAHDHYPRIRLHAYSYVPGVRVSGMLRGISDQHGRLRVGGRAAAHGVLRLGRDGTLRGRLR